jgi:phosphotriesterase-related protein
MGEQQRDVEESRRLEEMMANFTRRKALRILGGSPSLFLARRGFGFKETSFPKDAIIRTVLKDLHPSELAGGSTLFHEHMSLSSAYNNKIRATTAQGRGLPAPASEDTYFMEDLGLMSDELAAAKKDGVACLVDGGHPDMGRSVPFLKQLSSRSGMHIVASGGYYTEPFYPPEIKTMSEEQIAQELTRQAQTEPLGAFGEIGSWDEITEIERKVFRAVARAHHATNIPIFSHTGVPGKSALEQLDIFEKAGVKPQHVVIGHLGNLVDPEVKVHTAICRRGAYVGFDRQGGANDDRQVPMVVALIAAGYAQNVLLSSDFANAAQLKRNGGPGYAKTVTVFAPKLRAAGVNDDTLHGILVDNPRRFLAFVPKWPRKQAFIWNKRSS